MIRGQLHNEGSGIAGKHLGLLQHDAGNDDGSHADEVSGGGNPGAAAKQSACDHPDEGNLGAAGDKGGGHDGHATVTLIFDGTGSHDAGDTAAGTDEHGDEGLTGKAELTEDTVQYEGDTGHIAAGLQESQHQEQHQHLRHKAQHRTDTRHNTVKDQTGEPVGSAGSFQGIAYQYRNTGYPYAVISGVGLLPDPLDGRLGLFIVCHGRRLGGDSKGFLIFYLIGKGAICGQRAIFFDVGIIAVYD